MKMYPHLLLIVALSAASASTLETRKPYDSAMLSEDIQNNWALKVVKFIMPQFVTALQQLILNPTFYDKYVRVVEIPTSKQDIVYYSQFASYVKKFKKIYSGKEEYFRRFANFKESLQHIKQMEQQNDTAEYGPTKFSDLSTEEFSAMLLKSDSLDRNEHANNFNKCYRSELNWEPLPNMPLPKKFDWRDHGVITPVVNQLQCAACWAVVIVETMEAMSMIDGINFQKLSIEEVINCTKKKGCRSGNILDALKYLCATGLPVASEKIYPDTFDERKCKKQRHGVLLSDFCWITNINEVRLLNIIYDHGPVMVTVNAHSWMYYVGGVIQWHCGGGTRYLNHAVQLVGYDLTGPTPYFIAKNSWGDDYGDKGYVKLAFGYNTCGLADEVYYVDVKRV